MKRFPGISERSVPWVAFALGAVGLILVFRAMGMAAEEKAVPFNPERISPSTGIEFVGIPGGCYMMGDDTGYEYEKPVHEVCVDDFYLGRFEVTQQQWEVLMEENRSRFKGPQFPIQRVSWNDAMEFIRRLNEKEKTRRYRLPTEAEWERAARAGSDSRYFWGDAIDNKHAWYYGSAQFTMHAVGTSRPNAFGLHDMLGNVWEWVSDWYDSRYFERSPRDNPAGPATGEMKTRRGGSIANLASYVRSASRYRDKPDKRHYILGFRVAQSVSDSD